MTKTIQSFVNKKTGVKTTGFELPNGKWEMTTESGEVREVAASTKRRWYKKLDVEVAEAPKEEAPKEQVEEKEVKIEVGDLVAWDNGEKTGIVQDIVSDMATIKAGEEEYGKPLETLALVEKGEKEKERGNRPTSKKVAPKKEKTEKPKTGKTVNGFNEDNKEYSEDGLRNELVLYLDKIENYAYTEGVFVSKGKEYPRHIHDFKLGDHLLHIEYINVWGSSKVQLTDINGEVLYKSKNGTLKPFTRWLGIDGDQEKTLKQNIKMLRQDITK